MVNKKILMLTITFLIIISLANITVFAADNPPYYPEGTVIVYKARIMRLYSNGSVVLELNTTLMIVLKNVTSKEYCMDSKVVKYEVLQASPEVQKLPKEDFNYLVNNLIDDLEYYTEYCIDWNEKFEDWLWFMVFDIDAYGRPTGTSYIYEEGDYSVKPQYNYVDITTYGNDGILDVFVYISPEENIGFVIERAGGPIIPSTTTTTQISSPTTTTSTLTTTTTTTSIDLTGKWVTYVIEVDYHNETFALVGAIKAKYFIETGEGEVLDMQIKELRGASEEKIRENFGYIGLPTVYDEPIRKYEYTDVTATLYYDEDSHVLYRFEVTMPGGTIKGYLVDTNIDALKDKINPVQTTTINTQTTQSTSTSATSTRTTPKTTTQPTPTTGTTSTHRTTTSTSPSTKTETTSRPTSTTTTRLTTTETIAGGPLSGNLLYYIIIGVVVAIAVAAIALIVSRRKRRTYYPPPYQPPPPPPPP